MKTIGKVFAMSFLVLIFTMSSNAYAQGQGANTNGPANQVPGVGQGAGGPGDSYGPGQGAGQGLPQNNKGGDSIPLDGGISFLLAAAAFFGIKKLRGSKKELI